MSVGYDLAGIKSEKIDRFIEGLKDASGTEIWKDCREALIEALPRCKYMTAADVDAISANVCNSITLSTMHGCPAGEIEGIASYLMEVKGLNLYLKCNPTLLGYEYARKALDDLASPTSASGASSLSPTSSMRTPFRCSAGCARRPRPWASPSA